MKKEHDRKGRRLRFIPLILGIYGAFLGFGLMAIGLAEMKEGIGILRLLLGLGMAGFGLFGIWDGVRDLIRPNKKPEKPPVSQFILIDISGNKTSNVTMEQLQEQIKNLVENQEGQSFQIQILPPPSIQKLGKLKKISCIYQDAILLLAFFVGDTGGYWISRECTGPDMAEEGFRSFLDGNTDFIGWEKTKIDAYQGVTGADSEKIKAFGQEFLNQRGRANVSWHQLLLIFGESWHDEHKFFTDRDLALAVEGVHKGTYQKVVLEWGNEAFYILPGVNSEVKAVWCTNLAEKGDSHFLMIEGTATQVKFLLVYYLNEGSFEDVSDWEDITVQVESNMRKGEGKHGKVF